MTTGKDEGKIRPERLRYAAAHRSAEEFRTLKNSTIKIAWYAFTVFIGSALLLVQEVVAGRLIAPFVGVSLYTWTAVIGVILSGLSVGNWIGGVWADRGAGERATGVTLIGAALASLAIPLLLTAVAPAVQTSKLSLLSASLLLVLSLFFVPALLLGIVTPLLTTLALRLSPRTGHIVGMMHALAALGSIIGTFVTGYWLVQSFGSRAVVLGSAATLALLGLPLLRRSGPVVSSGALVLALALFFGTFARDGFTDPCERESSYFCIRVIGDRWDEPAGQTRSLVLDHLLHGINHTESPGLLIAPYVQLMDELVLRRFPADRTLNFFFVGGGAYTQPRAVKALYPNAGVTVAELDPLVTETARERLFVDTDGMTIHHTDARVALARDHKGRYDVIVTDAFHDIAVPAHLVTLEFARLVKSRLSDDGLYTMNLVDAFPEARLVKAMVKTLKTVFPDVHVWLDHIPQHPTRATYVISAGVNHGPPELIEATRGLSRHWFQVTEPVTRVGVPLDDLPILTDDLSPVESLMASLFLSTLGR